MKLSEYDFHKIIIFITICTKMPTLPTVRITGKPEYPNGMKSQLGYSTNNRSTCRKYFR